MLTPEQAKAIAMETGIASGQPAVEPVKEQAQAPAQAPAVTTQPSVRDSIATQGIAPPVKREEPEDIAAKLKLFSNLDAIDYKYGKIDGSTFMRNEFARKQLETEGMNDAVALIHSGDVEGGIAHFNQYGKYRGAKVIGVEDAVEDFNGTEIKTKKVKLEVGDGQDKHTITINPVAYFKAHQDADKQSRAIRESIKLKLEQAKETREVASDVETGRHNRAMEAISARKGDGSNSPTANIKDYEKYLELQRINPEAAEKFGMIIGVGRGSTVNRGDALKIASEMLKNDFSSPSEKLAKANEIADSLMGIKSSKPKSNPVKANPNFKEGDTKTIGGRTAKVVNGYWVEQ